MFVMIHIDKLFVFVIVFAITNVGLFVTGRRCPHSGKGEDFLMRQPILFYKNGRNSGTASEKIAPKVGNERSL